MWRQLNTNQKWMISILTVINLLNYIDRQIVFPLFNEIQLEFGLTDFQLGLIGTVFIVGFSLTTVPFGVLADRYSRKAIMFGGIMFWSVATFVTGLAHNFKTLLVTRTFVGFGEASYAPTATAMIADNFDQGMRARVQGVFHIGMFVGGTLGAMIGAAVVHFYGDWRLAFILVAIPGLVLGLMTLFLKDKRHVDHTTHTFSFKPLLHNPTYLLILISGTAAAFTTNAFVSWGVEYIRRYTDYSLMDASIILGVVTLIAGLVGVLVGSHIADHWYTKNKAGRSLLVACAIILSIPFFFIGFAATGNNMLFVFAFGMGILLISSYFGPVAAVVQDVVPGNLRATAFAVYVFVIHLLGGATAPAVVGWLSDIYELKTALAIATVGQLIAGIVFFVVSWMIIKQHRSVAHA